MTKPAKALYVLFLCTFGGVGVLSGCGSSAPKPPAAEFSSDFNGSFDSLRISGRVSAGRGGLLSLRLDEPETIGGLEIVYRDGCVYLREDAATCTADEAYLPPDSLPSLLKSAAGSVADGHFEVQGETDETVTYALENGLFLVTDKEGGFLSLKSGDGKLEFEFKAIPHNSGVRIAQ